MGAERMLARVQQRAAFADAAEAERAVQVVLETLGERLLEIDAEVVARRLPPVWAGWLRRRHEAEFDVDEFYRRIAERHSGELRTAVEQATVVCQVLAESVDEVALKHLRMRLPESFAALFSLRQRRSNASRVPSGRRAPAGQGTTLATGRPGGHLPVNEADGPLAHRHSVVRSDNPHEDSKISSGGGSQGRERGLAGARPGTSRPLSEGGD